MKPSFYKKEIYLLLIINKFHLNYFNNKDVNKFIKPLNTLANCQYYNASLKDNVS